MAVFDVRRGDTLEGATFDDIVINAYGDRGRIIAETGRQWILQSERFDNVRTGVWKFDPEAVIIVGVEETE